MRAYLRKGIDIFRDLKEEHVDLQPDLEAVREGSSLSACLQTKILNAILRQSESVMTVVSAIKLEFQLR